MSAETGPMVLYPFACPVPAASGATPAVVGHKAANLICMAESGLPVPPGFVLPTALCRAYFEAGQRLPTSTLELLRRGVGAIEQATGLTFGAARRPLLLSVRSGAPVSMPGMLDTVLNIGLCDRTLPALVRMTGNPRHAWDSYRRLIQTYAEVVHGLPTAPFERVLTEALRREDVPTAAELDVAALRALTGDSLDCYGAALGEPFPQDPATQLAAAVEAVFRSWQSPRAVAYRRLQGLPESPGTAAAVQAMVFGNMGATSGAGVGFTRDPATGENRLYVDFLANAQGEDVVSGRCPVASEARLEQTMPALYRELRQAGGQLERLFGDAQDFEFTVQEGRLYLLQSRDAKRTALAALRIACEQVAEGLIDEATALARLAGHDLADIYTTTVAAACAQPLAVGVPASPGVAVGEAVFDPDRAVALAGAGRSPILVRTDIATADIAALAASAGVLTARGGRTAHAAVVARQLDKVCIVGCPGLVLLEHGGCRIGDHPLPEGAVVSLDGQSGRVYAGRVEVVTEQPIAYLRQVEQWQARHRGGHRR